MLKICIYFFVFLFKKLIYFRKIKYYNNINFHSYLTDAEKLNLGNNSNTFDFEFRNINRKFEDFCNEVEDIPGSTIDCLLRVEKRLRYSGIELARLKSGKEENYIINYFIKIDKKIFNYNFYTFSKDEEIMTDKYYWSNIFSKIAEQRILKLNENNFETIYACQYLLSKVKRLESEFEHWKHIINSLRNRFRF